MDGKENTVDTEGSDLNSETNASYDNLDNIFIQTAQRGSS